MNPYKDPVTCSVCGGSGVAWAGTGFNEWLGADFVHKDPETCRFWLRQRENELRPKYEDVADGEGI